MEEKEKDGRSGLRIDVWEVKNPLLASPVTTEPPHRDTDPLETHVPGEGTPRTEGNGDSDSVRENITPPLADSIISDHEEEEQSKLNLTIADKMPSFNESQEEEQAERDYTPRKEFYDLNPACDRDVSMRSIEDNVALLAEIDGSISPHDLNDNIPMIQDDTQRNNSETESASDTESDALGMEIDARTINHSREGNRNGNSNTPRREMELLNTPEPRALPISTCWHAGFTCTLKNRYVRNQMYLLFTILIYQAFLKETAYSSD